MSTALGNIEWSAVTNSLADIHASNTEAEQFIAEMLDEVDRLRHDLHDQGIRLQRDRVELDQRRVQIQSDASTLDEGAQRELEQMRSERATLQEERDAAHVQLAKMAATALDLATARAELSESRTQLAREREKLAADDDTKTELLHRVGELEQERALLEAELESVRRRAAEMAETLEHKQWQAKTESVPAQAAAPRPTPEASAETTVEPRPTAPPTPPRSIPRSASGSDDANGTAAKPTQSPKLALGEDAALESVMAQFELIQRDIARRRAKQRNLNK